LSENRPTGKNAKEIGMWKNASDRSRMKVHINGRIQILIDLFVSILKLVTERIKSGKTYSSHFTCFRWVQKDKNKTVKLTVDKKVLFIILLV
jgi:hypothetical protein